MFNKAKIQTPIEFAPLTKKRWWEDVTRANLRVFLGAYLGWMFDGYETFTHVVVLPAALLSLLGSRGSQNVSIYFGWMLAAVLLGAGIGGTIGGILADYFGRKKVLLASIILYASLTGLSGLSLNIPMFAACRFLTGLSLGAEWATGMTLVVESWPPQARSKACGFLQSGVGLGAMLASGVWLLILWIDPFGSNNWRLAFGIGTVPALLTIFLRRSVDESASWKHAVEGRRWGVSRSGGEVNHPDAKRPFPLAAIWRSPESRRRLILTFVLSTTTSVGWWVSAALLPSVAEHLASAQGAGTGWGPKAALIFQLGGILAYAASGFLLDAWGRRNFLLFAYGGALIANAVTFLLVKNIYWFPCAALVDGFFALGCTYSWMATYLPELFPVSVRATATSAVFNGARIISSPFPIIAGILVQDLGGSQHTAAVFGAVYLVGLVVPWFLPRAAEECAHNL